MEAVAVELAVDTVKLVVGGLMQRLEEHKQLIAEALVHKDELEDDNQFLANYLKEAAGISKPKSNNLREETLLREVRESVYRAEDAIDSITFKVAERKSKWYSGAIPKSSTSNVEIAQLIKSVAESVRKIRQKVEEHDKGADHGAENKAIPDYEGEPRIKEFCCIFEKEEERLKARLTRKAKLPEVIFITGTHGIGKTALAAKMFLDSDIKNQFNKHIWVSVPNPTLKDLLLVVLRQLSEDTPPKTIPYELRMQVQKFLEGKKLLLVLDNVPEMSKEDFESLCSAFGKCDEGSRILITSNNDKLAAFVRDDSHIKLEPLELGKSWALLEWRVFSGDPYDPVFKIHGELIAAKCNGLPQTIISAGDDLVVELRPVKGLSEKIKVWQHFSGGKVLLTLSSYNALPYHLRPCFLYLGIFPRKSKFSVSKLTQMWIAEGFIPKRDRFTLEETALEYLTELIERNLVTIEEKRLDGKAKTCSIDEKTYDFCRKRSAEEGESNRRFCIHAHISELIISNLISSSHRIGLRSFVSHSKTDDITLQGKNISIIRAAFKLLRVLDAKPIKVNKIHSDLCLLVHLRYVTLTLNGDVLPASISNLRNVRTLIVHTKPSTSLEIKADILTMVELRHFKTNASATLPNKSKASIHYDLQTFCGISPKSCTKDFFIKTPDLKKLGVCGPLALLLDKIELLSSLDNVEKLKLLNQVNVEKLKLLNQVKKQKSKGDLSRLLDKSLRFPPNVRSLTLSATSLKWEHISNPGWMQKLEKLKLKDSAFVGEEWKVSGDGFPNLQTLHIEGADFTQWEASSNHFPKLTCLVLSECKELSKIPFGLADVSTFQELHLYNGSGSAAKSAREIFEEKLKKKQTNSSIVFRIFPESLAHHP